jgi:hypothetical protein
VICPKCGSGASANLLRRDADGTVSFDVLAEVAAKIERKIGWPAEGPQLPPAPWLQAFYRAQRARLEQKLLFGERPERKRDAAKPPPASPRGRP